MVWGESGGGAKTAAIHTMPDAAPLFHKASIESAAPLRFPTRAGATARAERTLELLGLTVADIPELHTTPAERLLAIQQSEAANGAPPWGDPGSPWASAPSSTAPSSRAIPSPTVPPPSRRASR